MEIGSNSALFCGPDNHRTAMHNACALHTQEFGAHFFSDTAALLGIPNGEVPLEDIPDPEVQDKIQQVHNY